MSMKTAWMVLAVASLVFAIPAPADFAAGLAAYQKQDYGTALKEWQPLADGGSRDAQYNVALLYLDGKGVARNYDEALKWLERAANQGQLEAQHDLGASYARGEIVKRDYVQAYKWLSLCAAKGNGGCVTQRDLVEKKLKASKLAEAQRQAGEWKPVEEPAK
jgi:TPR repeat protein